MKFDYSAFISELDRLINVAAAFNQADMHYESESFRKWRHETSDIIHKVERLGYSINCNLVARQFHIFSYSGTSSREQTKKFQRDLTDTINELNYIVDDYKKYGAPLNRLERKVENKSNETSSDLSSGWPDKVTLAWLWKHMPAKIWIGLIAAFLGAISVGYGFRSLF